MQVVYFNSYYQGATGKTFYVVFQQENSDMLIKKVKPVLYPGISLIVGYAVKLLPELIIKNLNI